MVIGSLFLSLGKLILWWVLGRVRWRLVRLSLELTLKYCLKSVRRHRGSRERAQIHADDPIAEPAFGAETRARRERRPRDDAG